MAPFEVRSGVYISDADDARRYGYRFDHVITLSRNPDDVSDDLADNPGGEHKHTTDHIPLWDDGRTTQSEFDEAVETTIEAIESDGSVLVHCNAGVSRSSTVLITALATIDDSSWDMAYSEVKDVKPTIAPHPELRKLALAYLGTDGSVYRNPF